MRSERECEISLLLQVLGTGQSGGSGSTCSAQNEQESDYSKDKPWARLYQLLDLSLFGFAGSLSEGPGL